jgi:hypothetical protein
MKKEIVISLGLAIALFSDCGSSSSSSDGGGSSGSEAKTGTGYYIDAAVKGASFKCGSESGVTDENGKFTFEKGKDCSFEVAGVTLREVKAENLVDNVKIIEDNATVAAFLQSIDKDGNTSNGIQIEAEVLEALKTALKDHNSTNSVPTEDKLTNVVNDIKNSVSDFKGEVVTPEKAMEHVKKSQTEVTKELFAGKTLYAVFIGGKDVEKLIFNANATSFTSGSEKTAISFNGNKTIFDDNSYAILREKTADYLLMDDYNADGTKESVTRIYFTKAKAEAYLNSLKNDNTPSDKNDLKALLAGKTFWEVDNQGSSRVFLNKVSFNSEFNKITLISDIGSSDEKIEYMNITYSNGKINFSTGGYTQFKAKIADYIDLADSDGETTRLYFDRTKAEAYLNSLK